MKILIASAGAIYVAGLESTARFNSGFSHMIRNVAEMLVEQGNEVDVLTQKVFTQEYINQSGWRLVRRRIADLALSFDFRYLKQAFRVSKQLDFKHRLHAISFFLTGSYLEKLLVCGRYDAVHIHGIGYVALPFIMACSRTKTPFALTMHGLISMNETVKTDEISKKVERGFIGYLKGTPICVSTVSTGVKTRMEMVAGAEFPSVRVICNPCAMNRSSINASHKPMILCVGNLSKRKNQIAVVRAFAILQNKYKYDGVLSLVGGDIDNEKARIKEYITAQAISNVDIVGILSPDEVKKYYQEATLLVTASYDEGFGMPIIEGYGFGLPSVFYSDIDACKDLSNPNCSITVDERTDDTLANAIYDGIDRKWDRDAIKEFSHRFSFSTIGKQYNELMHDAIASNARVNYEKLCECIYDR